MSLYAAAIKVIGEKQIEQRSWLEGIGMRGVRRLASAATVQPTAIACSAEKLEQSHCFSVALGRSRLGIVRPDNFAEGNG